MHAYFVSYINLKKSFMWIVKHVSEQEKALAIGFQFKWDYVKGVWWSNNQYNNGIVRKVNIR